MARKLHVLTCAAVTLLVGAPTGALCQGAALDYVRCRAELSAFRADGSVRSSLELDYEIDAGTMRFRVVDASGPQGQAGRYLLRGYTWIIGPNIAEVRDRQGTVVAALSPGSEHVDADSPLAEYSALGPMLATASRTFAIDDDAWGKTGTDATGTVYEATLDGGHTGRCWIGTHGATVREEIRDADGALIRRTEHGDFTTPDGGAGSVPLLSTTRIQPGVTVETGGTPSKPRTVRVPRVAQTAVTTYTWHAQPGVRLPLKRKTYDGSGRLVCMVEYGDYTLAPPLD